jgi:hypothetical protein
VGQFFKLTHYRNFLTAAITLPAGNDLKTAPLMALSGWYFQGGIRRSAQRNVRWSHTLQKNTLIDGGARLSGWYD